MTTTWSVSAAAYGLTQELADGVYDDLIAAGAQSVMTDMPLKVLRLRLHITAPTLTEATARAAGQADALFTRAGSGLRLTDLRVREAGVPTEDSDLMNFTRLGLHLGVSRTRAAAIAKAYSAELPVYAYRQGYPLFTPEAVDTFVRGWSRAVGRPKRT